MSPYSNSTFLSPAHGATSSSDGLHIRTAAPSPPSRLTLGSVATKTGKGSRPAKDCLSPLPTPLLKLMKSWLIDKEALQLILCNHHLHDVVQGFYTLQLRPTATQPKPSPIARYQNTVNILPALIPMGEDGEAVFQQCLHLKAACLTESAGRDAVIQFLQSRLSEIKDPRLIRDVIVGATLGLGGTAISPENRDALVTLIVRSLGNASPPQAGAMVSGVLDGFGQKPSRARNHGAVLDQILATSIESTPPQMGYMIQSLCRAFGGASMPARNLRYVTAKLLSSCETTSLQHIRYMFAALALSLGGKNIAPQHRDVLMQQILANYDLGRDPKLSDNLMGRDLRLMEILNGLYNGFGGRDMSRANSVAVLAAILSRHAIWGGHQMASAIVHLGIALGREAMSPDHRDTVLAAILASCRTCSAAQMGEMILAFCRILAGANPVTVTITPDNLDVVIREVLKSRGAGSPQKMGAMLQGLYRALGAITISSAHRDALAGQIQESGRMREIVAALQTVAHGQEIVDTLQLTSV